MDVAQIQLKLHSEKQAFLDDLRPKYIIPSLLKDEVITVQEKKDILSEKQPKDQVEKLFTILTKKSHQVFPNFIKALKVDLDGDQTYPWLAAKLEINNDLNKKVTDTLINGNVPFSIDNLIHRPEPLSKIRQALIRVAEEERRHWVVLFGPIGCGKTILAAESLRNNDLVEKHFRGGIYWINVGDSKEEEALWLKMRRLLKMMGFEGELHPKDTICDLTLMLKKEVVRKQSLKMLLVLDDVWHESTIKAFDIGCPVLVTTKNKNTMMKVSSFCTDIECKNDFSIDEILELLAKYVKCEKLPDIVKEICYKCKGSPLVTSLIGGKMAHAGGSEKAWNSLNDRLETPNGMQTVRKRYCSGDSERDLSDIVNLCLEPIERYKKYYLDFLIFIKDIPVPNDVLEILWDKKKL